MGKEPMTAPLVSVIMPAYNAGGYIAEAIRSVQAQTVVDWELLVLDDGSGDDTRSIVESLAQTDQRIRYLRNSANLGVSQTRNRGFELCGGRFVALLDSDDIWYPDKLEKQLARMSRTNADFSYTSYGIMDAKGEKARADYLVPEEVCLRKLLKENVIGCSTVMLTREMAEKYRFCTEYYHEDYVLWLKLLQDGRRAAGCPEVLANWRYLPNSRSFNKQRAAANRWNIYRLHLKLPLHQCLWLFANYILGSLRKYRRSIT